MGKGNGTTRTVAPKGVSQTNTGTKSIPKDDKSDRWLGEHAEQVTSEISNAIRSNPAFKNAQISVTNAFGLYPAVQVRGLATSGSERGEQNSELWKIQNSLSQKYGLGMQGITTREFGYRYGNDIYVYINRLNSASVRGSRESASNQRWENLKRYLLSKR